MCLHSRAKVRDVDTFVAIQVASAHYSTTLIIRNRNYSSHVRYYIREFAMNGLNFLFRAKHGFFQRCVHSRAKVKRRRYIFPGEQYLISVYSSDLKVRYRVTHKQRTISNKLHTGTVILYFPSYSPVATVKTSVSRSFTSSKFMTTTKLYWRFLIPFLQADTLRRNFVSTTCRSGVSDTHK